MKPTIQHLRLMRNIEAGRNELTGFTIEQNGLRAFFECVLYGWVDRGQLTTEGRSILIIDRVSAAP